MGTTINQVLGPQKSASTQVQTTVYSWNGKKYPLRIDHSVAKLCTTIKKMQEGEKPRAQYISVLLCGQSGSGKSTLAQTMIHHISCKNKEPYVVKWFSGKDLHELDNIIDKLEKGLSYIMVFDDVSFIMDFLPSKRKKELAEKLTRIRHDVSGKVITFMNIHYQKALMPMMRDANFRILTSMSDQDSQNWKNTIGWKHRWAIDNFQKQYAYQMAHGSFFINNAGLDGKSYHYTTDKPFRVALCSEISGLHPLVFPATTCAKCSPTKTVYKNMKLTGEQFFKKATKGYKTSARTALRYWYYSTYGDGSVLPKNGRLAYKKIESLAKEYVFDKDELKNLLVDTLSKKSLSTNDTED